MTITQKNDTKDILYDPFLEALLSGNKRSGSAYIHKLLEQGMAFPIVYEQVIKQALYRVGELWEHNKISVAEEHLATSISEAIMNELFAAIISPHRCSKKVLVGCVEQEQHQVGAKMVADMFESKGWDSYYLGANIPATELINFARQLKPDMIALSVSIYFHMPLFEKMVKTIYSELTSIPILVGGQAFRHGGSDVIERYSNTTLIKDLYDLEIFIDNYSQT